MDRLHGLIDEARALLDGAREDLVGLTELGASGGEAASSIAAVERLLDEHPALSTLRDGPLRLRIGAIDDAIDRLRPGFAERMARAARGQSVRLDPDQRARERALLDERRPLDELLELLDGPDGPFHRGRLIDMVTDAIRSLRIARGNISARVEELEERRRDELRQEAERRRREEEHRRRETVRSWGLDPDASSECKPRRVARARKEIVRSVREIGIALSTAERLFARMPARRGELVTIRRAHRSDEVALALAAGSARAERRHELARQRDEYWRRRGSDRYARERSIAADRLERITVLDDQMDRDPLELLAVRHRLAERLIEVESLIDRVRLDLDERRATESERRDRLDVGSLERRAERALSVESDRLDRWGLSLDSTG